MSADLLIEKYIAMRDKIAQMTRVHEDEVAPLKKAMIDIENHFLADLNRKGAQSFGTKAGVVFKSTVNSATIADKAAFHSYLLETNNWALADIRAAKTAIKEFVETKEELPPGINWRSEVKVRINRP